MNENRLNPLLEAMNNIDDNIVIKTEKKSGKPLRMGIVAAASLAAALALAVGIRNYGGAIGDFISSALLKSNGTSSETPDFGKSETLSPDNSEKVKYTIKVDGEEYLLDVYPQNIVIPDSFMVDDIDNGHFFYDLKMRSTEIFAEFGISPLINDNFTDIIEFEPMYCRNDITGEEWYYNGGPSVSVGSFLITFEYRLYNKNINKNVHFTVDYFTDTVSCGSGDFGGNVIYMKDGSVGIIGRGSAFFTCNGVVYHVGIDNANSNTDEINQVLTDLGVL